ncbi:MAG: VTT domain-containing protein [Pseudomonadota bacterium]
MAPKSSASQHSFVARHARLLVAAIVIVFVVLVLIARLSGALDFEAAGRAAAEILQGFGDSPLGPVALIAIFVVGAFLAVPQFVLIGVSIITFGAIWGTGWAWLAALFSGSVTYWAGRGSSATLLNRFAGVRLRKITQFVSRNAFVASAVVRNVPTGPFLIVNMVFGAVKAPFLPYLLGLALGVVPKILIIAFGFQAIQAALTGQTGLAIVAAVGAVIVFMGGWLYVRQKRRAGEILSLSPDDTVDTAQNEAQ